MEDPDPQPELQPRSMTMPSIPSDILSSDDEAGFDMGQGSDSDDDGAGPFPSSFGKPWVQPNASKTVVSRSAREEAGQRLVRIAERLQAPSASQASPGRSGSKERSNSVPRHLKLSQRSGRAGDSAEPGAEGERDSREAPGTPKEAAQASSSGLPTLSEEARLSDAIPTYPSSSETVIIFDWDDTLFPTWFVSEVLIPCVPDVRKNEPLPKDSPFAGALSAHSKTVRSLLHTARSIGRVGFVTLSQRPWVSKSAARYMPDLDIEGLCHDMKIPIVYARECVKRPMLSAADVEEGVSILTVAKQQAMAKALKKLYGRGADWVNVLSIGDSIVERDAIKELLWSQEQESDRAPLCKTVKLMDEPSVEQLGAELVLLSMWLRSMASHQEDFDIAMDDSEETMLKMHKHFCP